MRIKGLSEFVGFACRSYPKEVAGFLFAKNIYSPQEVWMIQPVKNISPTPEQAWQPDKKDMMKGKAQAARQGFIKIGNIHSHPYIRAMENVMSPFDAMNEQVKPSEKDLSFARKFNDLVRIIILVNKEALFASFVHDKFGNEIKVMLHDEQCGIGDL